MAWAPSAPKPSAGRLPGTPEQRGIAIEALAVRHRRRRDRVWAAPLATASAPAVVERALIIALPVDADAAVGARSRYLSRPEASRTSGAAAAPPAGGRARRRAGGAVRPSGALAGLLTLTWTGGTIVIRRHWSLVYAGMVVLASAAMVAGLPATNVLTVHGRAATVGVGLALRARIAPTGHPPGPGAAPRSSRP